MSTCNGEAYRVEVETDGCEKCGYGRLWAVVGPDGDALGRSFEDEEGAADLAEKLNAAYSAGVAAAAFPAMAEETK